MNQTQYPAVRCSQCLRLRKLESDGMCKACHETNAEALAARFVAQQYAAAANDATVTADDIRHDNNLANAEGHAEGHDYDPECYCDACEQIYADAQGNDDFTTNPVQTARTCPECGTAMTLEQNATVGLCPRCFSYAYTQRYGAAADAVHDRKPPFPWSARLAARAASIVSAAGGLALAISCLTGTPASANTLPLVPTDGECVITHQFEDGSATALCGPNDAWAYDADGGYVVDNGIVFYYRAPGTWYEVKR